MMKLTPPQPEQAPQAPLIKVYLTDAQFNELRAELVASLSLDLVRSVVQEEIKQEKAFAPYLNKTKFSIWSWYSRTALEKFIKNGLPVSEVDGIQAIGKETFKQFMKEHEQLLEEV